MLQFHLYTRRAKPYRCKFEVFGVLVFTNGKCRAHMIKVICESEILLPCCWLACHFWSSWNMLWLVVHYMYSKVSSICHMPGQGWYVWRSGTWAHAMDAMLCIIAKELAFLVELSLMAVYRLRFVCFQFHYRYSLRLLFGIFLRVYTCIWKIWNKKIWLGI